MKKIIFLTLLIMNLQANDLMVKAKANISIREQPDSTSKYLATFKKDDIKKVKVEIYDEHFYKLSDENGYISIHFVDILDNLTKNDVENLISSKIENAINDDINKSSNNVLGDINTSENNILDDRHMVSLAKTDRNKALRENLVKLASPKPVLSMPLYARVLIFPYISKNEDIYYDYSYSWVKISREKFVLGSREGKQQSDFGINYIGQADE